MCRVIWSLCSSRSSARASRVSVCSATCLLTSLRIAAADAACLNATDLDLLTSTHAKHATDRTRGYKTDWCIRQRERYRGIRYI